MVDEKINEELFQAQLSGIYSRDFFFVLGENLLTIAKRYNRKTSLVYIHIENLDEILNSHGKEFAETHVESFCHSLRSLLRESDFLSRISQDSLGIHVTETDSFGTLMLIKRLENTFCFSGRKPEEKESLLQLNIVHTTAPDEGKTIADLISKAIEKTEKKRKSLAFETELKKSSFWDIVDLVAEGKFQSVDRNNFSHSKQNLTFQLQFTPFFMDQVQKYIFQDIILNKERNGVLLMGIRNFSNPEIGVQNYHALKNVKTLIYVLGLKGSHPLPMPYIIPVYLNDKKISSYRFIFFLCDKYAYGLIGLKRDKNLLTGFHSSDFYFIEHIISRIQQYYFY